MNSAQFCWLLPVSHAVRPILWAACSMKGVCHRKHDRNLPAECHSFLQCSPVYDMIRSGSFAGNFRSIAALDVYLTWMLENTLFGLIPICYQLNGSIRLFFFLLFFQGLHLTSSLKLGRRFHSNCNAQQPLIFEHYPAALLLLRDGSNLHYNPSPFFFFLEGV